MMHKGLDRMLMCARGGLMRCVPTNPLVGPHTYVARSLLSLYRHLTSVLYALRTGVSIPRGYAHVRVSE